MTGTTELVSLVGLALLILGVKLKKRVLIAISLIPFSLVLIGGITLMLQ
jgi:hypothetical protein